MIKIGTLVHVEIDGVLVTPAPVRVTAIHAHMGQTWVLVEGSHTGVTVDQVVPVKKKRWW